MHHTYGDLRKYKTPSEQLCLSPESEHECGLTLHGTQVSSGSMRQMAQVARAEVGYGTDRPAPVVAIGWGPAGADGTSTKPSGLGGTAGGAAGEVAICFFRSMRRNRNCLATREGGKVAAKATA